LLVEVCLNMPLWGFSENNLTDITIDIASLCQQLDILCKKELQSVRMYACYVVNYNKKYNGFLRLSLMFEDLFLYFTTLVAVNY
jgi:hypothetical protein